MANDHPPRPVEPQPERPAETPAPMESAAVPSKAQRKKEREKEKRKEKRAGRGFEAIFRISHRMHVEMSAQADSKANIMISINGIMISVILAAISPKIAASPWLLIPTTALLVSCVVSLTFAVLAARPRITRETRGATTNLMFFGSFVSITPERFEAEVAELAGEPARLYRSMARDLYALGKVLERKFRLLRTAYTIFIGGLVLGVALYIAVYLMIVFAPATTVLPAV